MIILVDSDPGGAQILHDGNSLGETPQNVTLAEGKTETLVLRKVGFLDQPLVLDAQGETRRIVKLVRLPVTKGAAKTTAAKTTAAKTEPPAKTCPWAL